MLKRHWVSFMEDSHGVAVAREWSLSIFLLVENVGGKLCLLSPEVLDAP